MSEIERLFKEHYRDLCVMAQYYLNDFDEAQDVVQGIFFKLIQQDNKATLLNPKSYLKVAVRNESLKRIKTNKSRQSIGELDYLVYQNGLTNNEEALAIQKKIKLYEQINLLPNQCKKIFLLCALDGLKYQETADILNISVNTVKTQMKKAFKILRSSLKDINVLFILLQKK